MTEAFQWTVLAHLLRPQGRRGELLAELYTDPTMFDRSSSLYLARPGFTGKPEEARAVQLASHWLPTGRNEGRIVLGLAGIDSITAAESLAGLELVMPSEERPALEEDAVYVDDLVGSTVFDREEPVGEIVSVYFSTTPDGARRLEDVAPLLTVVTKGGDEVLIPYVKAFLDRQDTAAKQIYMQLPEGLLDLNT